MNLTQKEKIILKELITYETLCAEKYQKYSYEAEHKELKSLFQQICQIEKNHCDLLIQMNNGILTYNSYNNVLIGSPKVLTVEFGVEISPNTSKEDRFLCLDALATEKYMSFNYDKNIFDFKEDDVRNLFSRLQREEQEHGKKIIDYMYQNGMHAIK